MKKYPDALTIKTSVLQGGELVPLHAIDELRIEEPGYMMGSIVIATNDVSLITDDDLTDIVFWWAQIPIILRDIVVMKEPSVTGYFLDSTAEMRFLTNGNRLTWKVDGAKARSTTLDLWSTIRTLFEQCRAFFLQMKRLDHSRSGDYDAALSFLAKVAPALAFEV